MGLVEIYDLDILAASKLANISTRAFVNTGDDIVIAGFILNAGPGSDTDHRLRGLGPSLAASGLTQVLGRSTPWSCATARGTLFRSDDNWQDNPAQAALISGANLAPGNAAEAAIAETLAPGCIHPVLLAGATTHHRPWLGGKWTTTSVIGGDPQLRDHRRRHAELRTNTNRRSSDASDTNGPARTSPTPTPGGPPCTENFDGVTAPAFPAGWVAINPVAGDGITWLNSNVTAPIAEPITCSSPIRTESATTRFWTEAELQ